MIGRAVTGHAVIGRATAIVLMSRPPQLALVASVALLGASLARARGANPDPVHLLVGIGLLLMVAASIHLANEFADHETDARTRRTPFSGGSGTLPRTGLPPQLALHAAVVALVGGIAVAVAAFAAGVVSGAALLLLAAGAIGGWAYSAGPFPLAWHGIGEVDNALLGGMLLPLYGVALAGGALDLAAVAAFCPLALVVGANLLATTWPDRDADASVGKRTLATRWPTGRLRAAYAIVIGAALVLLAAQAVGPGPLVVAVAGLTVAPLLLVGLATYTRIESPLATVAAMLWLIGAQLVAWLSAG